MRQDNTYEGDKLLKALDLPVDGEPVKRRRLPDYKTLQFFDYEHCFSHYAKCIMNIKQAKIHGEIIVAKPVLILALIDGIGENVFFDNKLNLSEWLESHYKVLMSEYTRTSQFSKITGIENPFWHLVTDGFWILQYIHEPQAGVTPSKKWLKDNVEYACLDEELWILLQNKTWRLRLRNFIVEKKLEFASKI